MPVNKKPSKANLDEIRHSLAHLLAAAVLKKFPEAKLAIGPSIDTGFYYDFKLPRTLTPEDLKEFEKMMRHLAKQNLIFKGEKVSLQEARTRFKDQPFKLELIEEFTKGKQPLTIYHTGDVFSDLCRGGHIMNTKDIPQDAFALDKIAGAYWRGDEKKPMLQRIYGLAFASKKDLDAHRAMMEEAQKRDHRKLGQTLKLFAFSDYVGPGLPLWLPNGTVIIEELERLAKDTERKAGYLQVRTPHIAKESMYKTSGHLPYYKDSMFPPMTLAEETGKETYYLRAMNCPHHHQIYSSEPRSYRSLPLRIAEYGTVYRYEKSGELFGLMRVRMLSMNDAHIYCTPEQFADEFRAVNDMYLAYFKLFGIKKYLMRFSTHAAQGLGKKYVNEAALWKKTEDMVRTTLKKSKIDYVEAPDEAAFYGPKIDVQVWSAIGKEFTIATNQVDFAQSARFKLTYTDKDGKEKTPIIIHRAPLGTHERFIGFLIEHFAGAFPLWLAPVQLRLLPVSEKHAVYAKKVRQTFEEAGMRVDAPDANETLGRRIRSAELEKIPYVAIVGDREVKAKSVSLRSHKKGDLGSTKLPALQKRLLKEIETRAL